METSGIYIHIPFCRTKCPYCSFASFTPERIPEKEYINTVLKEIERRSHEIHCRNVETIYFGGGTPSLISPAGISLILSTIANKFRLTSPEITIEANPGTVNSEKLCGYKDAGINRISIGIQSFNDRLLMNLGRSHNSKDVMDAFKGARKAGFNNIGIDLIHSISGESLQDWKHDLAKAVSLQPEHISAYNLTIEEHTPFHHSQERGLLALPEEETQTDMMIATTDTLSSAGYEHYEVSNYAIPGFRSRHNQIYWRCGDYYGFGVSAYSFYRRGWGMRMANSPDLNDYMHRINKYGTAVVDKEILDRREAMAETIFLGLRMMDGVDLNAFEDRFGTGIEEAFPESVSRLVNDALLVHDKKHLKLTEKGLLLSSEVALSFI